MTYLLGQLTSRGPTPLRYELVGLDQLEASPLLAVLLAFSVAAAVGLTLARSHYEPGSFEVRLVQVLLRLTAVIAVALSLLGLTRRPVEVVERSSRVVVIVDDSQSMGLPAGETSERPGPRAGGATERSREQQVEDLLVRDGLLAALGERHEVQVVRTGAPAEALAMVEGDEAFWPPTLSSTPLGDALTEGARVLGGPTLAAMVLVSDGGQNAGRDPVEAAAVVGAPVYTIGVGPTRLAPRIQIVELVASETAYPDDPFEVTVVIETQGDWSSDAALKIVSLSGTEEDPVEGETLQAAAIDGARDASTWSESFQVTAKEVGAHRYRARLEVVDPASHETASDLKFDFSVDVVDKVVRVLLWSGGPSRDYQFLRNQLFRDDSFQVTVLLDSAELGAAQEAAGTIERFPATSEELDAFDVLAIFDADLSRLTPTEVDMIVDWVSAKGGGLLYRPGLVYGPRSLDMPAVAGVRRLLPVDLPIGFLATQPARNDSPTPVTVTRAGQSEPMMRLAATPETSLEAWRNFNGFFAYYPDVRAKPSATVYATLNPPGGEPTPLLSDQFYGAGRTACLTTGETWRLRSEGAERFELLFTNLLRKLASGRAAARQQGVLVFERSGYELGETMTLYARLPKPVGGLEGDDDLATALIVSPDGQTTSAPLVQASDGPGAASAKLLAAQLGRYSASVSRGAGDDLTAIATVAAPERERGTLVRDEQLLRSIAQASGGQYYADGAATLGEGGRAALADAIEPRTERITRFGEPDRAFEWRLSRLLLWVAGGALILEWLLRRWNRLL
ncbi:hypothetical protein Pla175_21160 [Pirellulimonas nuda]|uniref:VWFA domain-containing protein n=1 Tax=Pirellulimonas nuda TaxID=2528009 RepID=A0A518DB72_9BACT|nr:hypothetical protein [Pirellulimonas nuda]QDU88734.1 hypothetical protein Pla175_21160 [Pirellulimonas nuda]